MSMANPTWLRRLILKDKRLKLLSLVIAILAWYGIKGTVGERWIGRSVPTIGNDVATRTMAGIPVSVIVRPETAMSVALSSAKVDVILSGSSSVLQKLTRADITVLVDCGDLHSSTNCELPVLVKVPQWVDVSTIARPAFVGVALSQVR
jgi:YbbR domain-containing protein